MARFQEAGAFTPTTDLQLLPLRFERLRGDRYLVNNFVGDGLLLNRQELDRIVSLDLTPGDGLYERAFEKLLVSAKGQQSQLQLLAMRLRSRIWPSSNIPPRSTFSWSPYGASTPAPIAKCPAGAWTASAST
jgi:uncharacterized protein